MLDGVLPKSRCRFLHLDFDNTEVVPWDLGKNKLPISGCRNLHVALGNSLTSVPPGTCVTYKLVTVVIV